MSFLKKNWYLVVPAALLAAPFVIVLYISSSYGYSFSEAWECFKATGKSNTKFQTLNYSESRFKRIVPGMSGKDVFELTGLPLERHDNDTRWCFSVPVGGAAYYHERTVMMQNGKVVDVIFRFHTPETK